MDFNAFAQTIKAKYPDYKDIDNKTLAEKIIAKYPEYKSQVEFGEPEPQAKSSFLKEKKPILPTEERIKDIARAGHPVLATIAGVGKDIGTIGAHFVNQLGFNYPRSIASSMGYEYPVEAGTKAARIAAPVAGVAGAVFSPINKIGALTMTKRLGQGATTGAKLLNIGKKAAVAGGMGAAYAPSEDVIGLKERGKQAAFGAVVPVVGAGVGKVISGVKNYVSPESVTALTKAIKPAKTNKNWGKDAEIALPIIKSTGTQINNLDDFVKATAQAKKNTWEKINNLFKQAGGKSGNTLNGNEISLNLSKKIEPESMALTPEMSETVYKAAQKYQGKQISIGEAENRLQKLNADLTSYFRAGNRSGYVKGMQEDINSMLIEREVLRQSLYDKIQSLTGENIAPLKKQYGALMNIHDEALGRVNVSNRQNPLSLQENINLMFGAAKTLSGHPIAGTTQIAGSLLGKYLNTTDHLIRKAVQNTGKTSLGTKISNAVPAFYKQASDSSFNQPLKTPPPLPFKKALGNKRGLYGGQGATGFKSAEGKFSALTDKMQRFEISDEGAKIQVYGRNSLKSLIEEVDNPQAIGYTLDNILKHDELFKQYPDLKNIRIKVRNIGGKAEYNPIGNSITIDKTTAQTILGSDNKIGESTLLHEIQHAIQEKEGFARGGSPESVKSLPAFKSWQSKFEPIKQEYYNRLENAYQSMGGADKLTSDQMRQVVERVKNTFTPEQRAMLKTAISTGQKDLAYMRLAGEVEARDVSARMNLTPKQRLGTMPYNSQGIAVRDMIIDKNSGKKTSIFKKK